MPIMMKSSAPSAKAGCKGDVRMNRAVQARLRDPSLSLSGALFLGGYNYPSTDDASAMDDDRITLGQRKNQLNRRLRLARKNRPTARSAAKKDSLSIGSLNTQQKKSAGKRPASERLDEALRNNYDTAANPKKRFVRSKKEDDSIDLSQFQGHSSPLSRTLLSECIEKASPFPPVPPMPQPQTPNLFDNLPTMGMSPFMTPPVIASKQQVPDFEQPIQQARSGYTSSTNIPHRESALAGGDIFASCSSLAAHDPLNDINQPLQATAAAAPQSEMAQYSLPQKIKTLSEQENLMKHKKALRFFQEGLPEVYQRCMIQAGFSPADAHEKSQAYRAFTFDAWQSECQRLEDVLEIDIQNDDCFCSSTSSIFDI